MEYKTFIKLSPKWKDFFNEIGNIENFDFQSYYKSPYENIKIVISGIYGNIFDNIGCNLVKNNIQNIYIELSQEGFFPFTDGNFSSWEKQGIFLLPENSIKKQTINYLKNKKNLIWINLIDEKIEVSSDLIPEKWVLDLKKSNVFKKINLLLYLNKEYPISW